MVPASPAPLLFYATGQGDHMAVPRDCRGFSDCSCDCGCLDPWGLGRHPACRGELVDGGRAALVDGGAACRKDGMLYCIGDLAWLLPKGQPLVDSELEMVRVLRMWTVQPACLGFMLFPGAPLAAAGPHHGPAPRVPGRLAGPAGGWLGAALSVWLASWGM